MKSPKFRRNRIRTIFRWRPTVLFGSRTTVQTRFRQLTPIRSLFDTTKSRIRHREFVGWDSRATAWFGTGITPEDVSDRLNPKTGEVKEWLSPSGPNSDPYALTVVNDIIWYNESGMRPDTLVRFDPKTERFQSWAIPSGVGIIRNFGVTKNGNLIIHQTSSNRIGLVEIED